APAGAGTGGVEQRAYSWRHLKGKEVIEVEPSPAALDRLCLDGLMAAFKAKIGAGIPDSGQQAALPSRLVILRPVPAPTIAPPRPAPPRPPFGPPPRLSARRRRPVSGYPLRPARSDSFARHDLPAYPRLPAAAGQRRRGGPPPRPLPRQHRPRHRRRPGCPPA